MNAKKAKMIRRHAKKLADTPEGQKLAGKLLKKLYKKKKGQL
jgi:hypothetical protein